MSAGRIAAVAAVALVVAAVVYLFFPAVGSERWCDKMADTPKSDWSANDAADYARHCVFRR